MACQRLDFRIPQRTDFDRVITLLNTRTNVAIDITDYTFYGEMKVQSSDSDPVASFSFGILDALNGKFEWSLSHYDIQDVIDGDYPYEVRMTRADGKIKRLYSGVITIYSEIADYP